MDRREFLNWVGVGVLASSLPAALVACQGSDTSTETTPPETAPETPALDTSIREDGFQALGTIEQLDREGSIVDRKNAEKSVIILRNPETSAISALNAMCTHQGCTVELKSEEKMLSCPCHGSKFTLDGAVTKGPADKPLAPFEVKEEENLILVKVS